MDPRPNPMLLFASAVVFLVACMCGLGAPQEAGAPAPLETMLAAQEVPPVGGEQATATAALAFNVVGTPVQPAIHEQRRLTLEFPPRIRLGDSDLIRLTLEVDDLGNLTPTAQIEGNIITGQMVEIPNLYETHNVIAEARLDLAGVEVRPPDVISEPLPPGQTVTFFWSVRPQEAGTYRGTVWLHLRFVDKSTGEVSRKAVSAQIVELEAINFLGLSANFARGAGAVGSLVGGVLGFPFIDDLLKFLLRRLRRG